MELIVCGWDEVFILDGVPPETAEPRKVWSWRAAECPSLPEEYRALFGSTDDCKPVNDGRDIVISSSGGAAALVNRETGAATLCGRLANAHSVELLPRSRVAVAGSNTAEDDGLLVFAPGLPGGLLWSGNLPWGHGLVWDECRGRLWTLSISDLRAYRLADWDSASPALRLAESYDLPGRWGHDLLAAGDGTHLTVTANEHCWLFDRDECRFAPHPDLGNEVGVKCISTHPRTGRIAYVQAEGDDWWAERIHLLHPQAAIHLPGEHIYKARWGPGPG